MRKRTANNRRLRKQPGVTLIEILVAMTSVVLVTVVVFTVSLQMSRVYTHVNAGLKPQSEQLLAFKRMERDFHEAYSISINSTTTSLEITPPLKSTDAAKVITPQQSTDKSISPMPAAYSVRYFLGKLYTANDGKEVSVDSNLNAGTNYTAKPNTGGNTLFRIESTVSKDANGNYALSNVNRYIIIRNITLTQGMSLFSYDPGGNTPTSGTRLITITLNTPFRDPRRSNAMSYQCQTTQIAMRNIQGLP